MEQHQGNKPGDQKDFSQILVLTSGKTLTRVGLVLA
jgi:hypothetical protein